MNIHSVKFVKTTMKEDDYLDKYYKNIRQLIENNLVEIRKQELSSSYHILITYYNVGKELINAQGGEVRAKYGNNLIVNYSKKLTKEFGRGYDVSNLKRMRMLYLCFQKGGTPPHQLSWSHYYKLLSIKDESKRNYYINSAIEHNFSVRQLVEYMKSNAYERLVNKDNIKLKYINDFDDETNILDMIKNPILITINKSVDKITEKVLKKFMLEQIEKTMLELGVGFAYIGSEVPIKIDGKILRPDLVFFNTELACYVILELKIRELTIKDIGQIEFYVRYYDSYIKKPFYNETIGITISKKVNKNIINYNEKKNIKHSEYELVEK